MEDNFSKRKKEFENMIEFMKSIKKLSTKTKNSINKINEEYIKLTDKNTDPIELFGLDFFNFQHKVYSKQYDNQVSLFNFLNNRIYGDYYKLYKLILNYVKSNIHSNTIKTICESNSNLPKYDVLDDAKVFPEQVLQTINVVVINILEQLYSLYKEQNLNLSGKEKMSKRGFSIGNYVNTIRHKNDMIENQIKLYEGYIQFFNENHVKMLEQIKDKIQQIYSEISSDINFGHSIDDSDIEDNEEIEEEEVKSGAELLIHTSPPKIKRQVSTESPPMNEVVKVLGQSGVTALKAEISPEKKHLFTPPRSEGSVSSEENN